MVPDVHVFVGGYLCTPAYMQIFRDILWNVQYSDGEKQIVHERNEEELHNTVSYLMGICLLLLTSFIYFTLYVHTCT